MTIDDIRKLKPCYDPGKYLPDDWTGTVTDILQIEECPVEDRIWVAVRLAPRFVVECFAIDCAMRADRDAVADWAAAAASWAVDAATYAADAAAYAAGDAARTQERENQIDSFIMLLGE